MSELTNNPDGKEGNDKLTDSCSRQCNTHRQFRSIDAALLHSPEKEGANETVDDTKDKDGKRIKKAADVSTDGAKSAEQTTPFLRLDLVIAGRWIQESKDDCEADDWEEDVKVNKNTVNMNDWQRAW